MITTIIVPILLGSIAFVFKDNCSTGSLTDFVDSKKAFKFQPACNSNPKGMLGVISLQDQTLKITTMLGIEYILNSDSHDISSNLWKGWSLTLNRGFNWIYRIPNPPTNPFVDSYTTIDIENSKDCVTDGTHIFPKNKKIYVSGVFIPNLFIEIKTSKRTKRSLLVCPVITVNIADLIGLGVAACDTSSIDAGIEKKIKETYETEKKDIDSKFSQTDLGLNGLKKVNENLEERIKALADQNLFSKKKQNQLDESFTVLSKSIINEFKNFKITMDSQFTDLEISLLSLDIDVISLRIGLIKNQLMESFLNKYLTCDLFQDDFENMVSASKYYASYGGLIESKKIENSIKNISFILGGIIHSQKKIYEFLNDTVSIQKGEILMTGEISNNTKGVLLALNAIIKEDSLSIIKGFSSSSKRWVVVIGYAVATAINLLVMLLSRRNSHRTGVTETIKRSHHNLVFKVSALASVVSFELLIFQIIFALIM